MTGRTFEAFTTRVPGKDLSERHASEKGKAMARTAVTEVGVSVDGFVDAGGVLGININVKFFQDGRMVDLSTTAPFTVTRDQARALVKQALLDADYGEILDTAKYRVIGV